MLDMLPWLCLLAFFAGMIDAAVGGGGLIQIPGLMNFLPQTPTATVFGTNKFAAACGTLSAARHYLRQVRLDWSLVLPAALAAFLFSFAGAAVVSWLPAHIMRPLVLALLVVMAIYTLWKKDFGRLHSPVQVGRREKLLALGAGSLIGFYDGLFGPGTGSFLIFLFIRFFAFDFLHASAAAKCVNLATNIAALSYFIPQGHIIWLLALPMALANILGALSGSWLALRHGSGLIRLLFLALVSILIVKLGSDIWRAT